VLSALLIERKLSDLLLDRGVTTNQTLSLFKGRSADSTMPGMHTSDLLALETLGASGESAYLLRDLVQSVEKSVDINCATLLSLADDVYATCGEYGLDTNLVGQFPLPIDVLREFIRSGVLQSNYLSRISPSATTLSNAFSEATSALAQVSARPLASFSLEVRSNSFNGFCPVLYTSGGTAKSLYDATGNAFRFPTSFELQPGVIINLDAFTDVNWNRCPGSDPLEVISLHLSAVPTASGTDADGNLLPDEYEALLLVKSEGSATFDLDGDGYCDLQEYLDQTDPTDPASHATSAPVDLTPPRIDLNASTLSIDWPQNYATPFIFTVEFSTNLVETPFVDDLEIPSGQLSIGVDQADIHRIYRVKMRLR